MKAQRVTAPARRSVSILGATGSIGQSAAKLLRESKDRFEVVALTAQENVDALIAMAKEFRPALAAIGNEAHYDKLKAALTPLGIRAAAGEGGLLDAALMECDVLLSAIVGAAGLKPTLAAIKRGAQIGLANKECLVCAGELVLAEAKKHHATLLPVDSEHSAIFQVFDVERPERVEHITLTASGGPFRGYSAEALADVTPEAAVKHPNWSMGAKISVDSATLMNKGLEMIEAYHLFPLRAEQIEVVIHPESIIHGLVHYVDGSVLAQMSPPDMCTPIAVALAWPERLPCATPRLNLAELGKLTFEAPDTERFPALAIAREAMQAGGNAPAVLNAANEVAVARFLRGEITFPAIIDTVLYALNALPARSMRTLEEVMSTDAEARRLAENYAR